jgi:nucleotide-binding universal stress UspA family protein
MTILVGYVPTPQGDAALTVAAAEARVHGDHVLVVNMARDDKLVDAHRAARSDLDRLGDELTAAGIAHEVRRVEHGTDPADAILGLVETERPRVLVIGIRHRTPVGKLLLGSTAQRLLLEATCPVLAVKPG